MPIDISDCTFMRNYEAIPRLLNCIYLNMTEKYHNSQTTCNSFYKFIIFMPYILRWVYDGINLNLHVSRMHSDFVDRIDSSDSAVYRTW